MTNEIDVIPNSQAERIDRVDPAEPDIGKWYWVRDKDEKEPRLCCVTDIGSNYVEMTDVHESERRVHVKEFFDVCTYEPDAELIIKGQIAKHQQSVNLLMGKVQELTARLGATPRRQLAESAMSLSTALAVADSREPEKYKKELVKAKEKTLPGLFEEITEEHQEIANWMKAPLIPAKGLLTQSREAIQIIEEKIFSVELYAGLTENVKHVAKGKPADETEKLHLFQRRCYMDEECLLDYDHGGMDFEKISDFDKWLKRPQNMARLLPFPRSVVAFQVRRNEKEREFDSLRDFIMFRLSGYADADKWTFLYLRNGENLYRLDTKLEFGEGLFPDLDRQQLTGGQIYAYAWHGHFRDDPEPEDLKLISESTYLQMVEDERKAEQEYERVKKAAEKKYKTALAEWKPKNDIWKQEHRAWKKAHADWKKAEKKLWSWTTEEDGGRRGTPLPERAEHMTKEPKEPKQPPMPWEDHVSGVRRESVHYHPWNKDNINYDDITKIVRSSIGYYNRIALILQGLLDRSPVFQPHPPWKLTSPGGFQAALELHFDSDRALVAGAKPDFEAYRTRCNESLAVGSVTVGQEDFWKRAEAAKYNSVYHRGRDDRQDKKRYSPNGDPGPGILATVVSTGRGKIRIPEGTYESSWSERRDVGLTCRYEWQREKRAWMSRWGRSSWEDREVLAKASVVVPASQLLNVSAYRPGDYKQFFADPRTRADYLCWAPLLLEAEEYHAGNRKVREQSREQSGESNED